MFKRTLFSLLAVVVIVAGVIPGIIGIQAESEYQRLQGRLELLSRQAGFVILRNEYQRGWLTSAALTELDPGNGGTPLVLVHRIHHGPFAPDGKILLAWMETDLQRPDEDAQDVLHADLLTRFELDKSANIELNIPQFVVHSSTQNEKTEFSNVTGEIKIKPEDQTLQGRFSASAFSLSQNNKILMQGSELNSRWDGDVGDTSIVSGRGWIDLEMLSILADDGRAMEVTMLSISGESRVNGGMLDVEGGYSADKIGVNDYTFGPVEMRMNLRNLPAETLSKMQNDRSSNIPLELLSEILQAQPKMSIEHLYLFTPEGELDATLLAEFVGDGAPINPVSLIRGISVDGNLRITRGLLRFIMEKQLAQEMISMGVVSAGLPAEELERKLESMLEARLAEFEQQGYFERKDDGMHSQLKLRDGSLTINEHQLPLPFIMPMPAG